MWICELPIFFLFFFLSPWSPADTRNTYEYNGKVIRIETHTRNTEKHKSERNIFIRLHFIYYVNMYRRKKEERIERDDAILFE